jgi:hypothetical protein
VRQSSHHKPHLHNSLTKPPPTFFKLASRSRSHQHTLSTSTDTSQDTKGGRRRRTSSLKSKVPPTIEIHSAGSATTTFDPSSVFSSSGLTARSGSSNNQLETIPGTPLLGTPDSKGGREGGGKMSLSRSPSPRGGGGWSSPGLTGPYDSGRSSPRKPYNTMNGGGAGYSNGVTWASAKAKSEEVNGYPGFQTRRGDGGIFNLSRHARNISASLPKWSNIAGGRYAQKETSGRGRWYPSDQSKLGRLRTLAGNVTRKMKLRILLVFALMLGVILFYTTRKWKGS